MAPRAVTSDDARGAELLHLRFRYSQEARQDLVGVFPEQWRRGEGGARRVPESNRHPHRSDGARLGMRYLHEHAALAQMIALADFGHRLDAAGRYPGLVEPPEPFGGGTTAELPVERGDQ